MSLERDLKKSRDYEMDTYLKSLKAMYDNAITQNGELFDIAAKLTDNFQKITEEAILTDSRIIKIFRYSIAPSISQMKFGQYFGIGSIGTFENDRLIKGGVKYSRLKKIAYKIADFTNQNLDLNRFIWIKNGKGDISDQSLAFKYAKGWTCSISADQNAQTQYRNWRKSKQESNILSNLVELGYIKSSFSGIVSNETDIKIGEYTNEKRVQGRTIQKADVIVRSKKTQKIVLIEAKAVGVEIDSTKRIKECCDKANDWKSAPSLNEPLVASVIAGFFNKTGINNLEASNISVIWEHRISDLKEFL